MAACSPSTAAPVATAASAAKPAATAVASAVAAATGPAQQITVKTMDTMKFDPTTLTVKAGQPVEITVQNDGQIVHDFSLKTGVAAPIEVNAQPKNKATGTFIVVTPGTYEFICAEPGHADAGMKGTLTVQ